MATMVKEKRREKKKNKGNVLRSNLPADVSSSAQALLAESATPQLFENVPEKSETRKEIAGSDISDETTTEEVMQEIHVSHSESASSILVSNTEEYESIKASPIEITVNPSQVNSIDVDNQNAPYRDLNEQLEKMSVIDPTSQIEQGQMLELGHDISVLVSHEESQNAVDLNSLERVIPSAPVFEEDVFSQTPVEQLVQNSKPKLQCMSVEEAVRVYGGREITDVKAISEKEEAIVQSGLSCGTEHPLVELLEKFRYSLISVERERSRLSSEFSQEEMSRSTLWKVDKNKIQMKKNCKCGATVELKASYDHAQLIKERLPVAKLKLERLLKDIQETYCHHQHEALLSMFQIEKHIVESIECSRGRIREDLTLVLRELRNSDGAPAALAATLQRWAAALATALVDGRDLGQLLFLLHHLFRQTRSVRWAARAAALSVTDGVSAARALAVLDTLLSKLRLETALECVEEADEQWEELGVRGSGAVSSGTLRERDLVALVRALPLQDLVARLVLFTGADFRRTQELEWGDASGGHGLLKSCCGVRALLAVVRRAVALHSSYARLHHVLRTVACSALTALACLYHTPRAAYYREIEEKITVELEAAFAEGFVLFGTNDLHKLPTAMLSADTARDYCLAFITGIHEKSPKWIPCLSVEAPVLSCRQRVRIVSQAAVQRHGDCELARIVLDFLLRNGLRRKTAQCAGGCETAARECLPDLLEAYPHLHTDALMNVAQVSQDNVDPEAASVLRVRMWRPGAGEACAVLQEWARRCPDMLPRLLLEVDCTPHVGVSLQVQLQIADWLCSWAKGPNVEHAWRVLLRLRTHAVCWQHSLPRAAQPPKDVFSMACAVLCGEWGASIPLICSEGVSALCTIAASRPREAVHCLAPVMLVMSQSPESVSLTPKFAELFCILMNHGPSLVQRALGRGPASGAELLLRLVLAQLDQSHLQASVFPVWLHALWRVPSALQVLDIAALAARDWPSLDLFANTLVQEENHKEHVSTAVRYASTAPLLCECVLRAAHAQEMNSYLFPALVTAVGQQKAASQRIHVDNALQKINAKISSEELVIYRCATAALAAPLEHPSHVTLWRLFFHMYLQRPPDLLHNNSPPGGPLFFSGIIKSRVLSQLKKRLQETATYHHSQAETYKKDNNEPKPQTSSPVVRPESKIDSDILPSVTIQDLTGEAETEFERDSECDSDSGEEKEGDITLDCSTEADIAREKQRNYNMACYHTAAERLIREYSCWLEEGEKVQALPHHADIARFIPEQALEEAWKYARSRCRPPPAPELEDFPRPMEPLPYSNEVPKTPLNVAVASITSVKCRSVARSRRTVSLMSATVAKKPTSELFHTLAKHLGNLEKYAKKWDTELAHLSLLDQRLWELVAVLRVPRLLPPVKKPCPNNCGNIIFHLNEQEWCISTGAEREIAENRSAYLASVRQLTKPKPSFALTSAALTAIVSQIQRVDDAVKVLEIAWRVAGNDTRCSAAHAALGSMLEALCKRWMQRDGKLCANLISRWCSQNTTAVQQTLCGLFIAPRELQPGDIALVYMALLNANLPPHIKFSYLSKFEIRYWTETMNDTIRHALIEILIDTCQRYEPDVASNLPLLELISVHCGLLINGRELSGAVIKCAKASVDCKLPPDHWKHIVQAARRHASDLTLDQLRTLARDVGRVWWDVHTTTIPRYKCVCYAEYAASAADLFTHLVLTVVDKAIACSYVPETTGVFAWSALQDSWGPWVVPSWLLPPISASPHYLQVVAAFKDCIEQIMQHCKGSEPSVLQVAFDWVCITYNIVTTRPNISENDRAHLSAMLSALLAKLLELPWTQHQWFSGRIVQKQVEVLGLNWPELTAWSLDTYRATTADTLLRDLEGERELGPRLAQLLHIFTGTPATHPPQILEQACLLPWYRLPEAVLCEALDRFFAVHHNPAVAYHDLPQFVVVLYASELRVQPRYPAGGRGKRAYAVAAWTRAASQPALHVHRAQHARSLLHTLTELAPRLESDEEIVDLLCRAIVLVNMEPEQSSVVPVWQSWVGVAAARLARAGVLAARTVTSLPHAAALADAAIKAHLNNCEGGWPDICECLSSACWKEAPQYVSRGALGAAYACALNAPARDAAPALSALTLASHLNFIESEAIVAVWICFACRVARECGAGAAGEALEARDAARALLVRWGAPPRRSLLKVVTLQADTERPTTQHRLLARLAQCVLDPSPDAAQAYESACASLLGPCDVTAWGKDPRPKRLVRLATRLYPKHERYFQWELDLAPE